MTIDLRKWFIGFLAHKSPYHQHFPYLNLCSTIGLLSSDGGGNSAGAGKVAGGSSAGAGIQASL